MLSLKPNALESLRDNSEVSVSDQMCAGRVHLDRTETLSPLLECMQIRQQICHLLLIEDLRISRHHIAAIPDDIANLLIIRGQAALGKKLPLEEPFHARPLFPA